MKKTSIWLEGFQKAEDSFSNDSFETDILIIGGGMAGISAAFYLKDSKKKITLIDKGTVGFGVTAYTTAKVTYLQELIYQKIEQAYDFETAKQYLQSQIEACKLIEENVQREHIDCNYQKTTNATVTNEQKKVSKIKKEAAFLKKCRIPFQEVSSLPIQIPFVYGIKITDSAVFHPLKYLYGLKQKVEETVTIMENICATEITKQQDDYIVSTNKMTIKAHQVLVCTHYPFFLIPGLLPFRSHIEKSYVVAAPTTSKTAFSMITTGVPMHSLRFYQDHLLYGTYAHALTNHLDDQHNYLAIQKRFHKLFDGPIDYCWFNQDIITNDSLPFIGESSPNSNLFIATGFNTWGMTNGTIAGKVLSDFILTGHSPYQQLFSLHRRLNLAKIKNFTVDAFRYAKVFLHTTLIKNHTFYPSQVSIHYEKGKPIGTYIDEEGIKHNIVAKCPHMKCNLIFNPEEKTWDCPCHSSRFDIDGNLIKGPSTRSIKWIPTNKKK